MAVTIKFLLDNDLPLSLYEAFVRRKYTVDLARNRLPKENRAEDIEILLWACAHNWHLVTHDKGFLNTDTHPCDPERYARRTILNLPTYLLWQANTYLLAAWHATTWRGLREYHAIEVQQETVIAYLCSDGGYQEAQRWKLRP